MLKQGNETLQTGLHQLPKIHSSLPEERAKVKSSFQEGLSLLSFSFATMLKSILRATYT